MNNLGQYFTKDLFLQKLVFSLCKNKTKCLEPSSGPGFLVKYFEDNGVEDITCVELDSTLSIVSKTEPKFIDFFDYQSKFEFDTIFGNPPFVKFNSLTTALKEKLNCYSINSCNLFYYFIEKCYNHLSIGGELVFIVPRELFTSTRAKPLREMLYKHGTITDVYDFGESRFFKDAAPSVVIFRYEKGNMTHKTNYLVYSLRNEVLHNSSLLYCKDLKNKKLQTLSEVFDIKVGLVTGCNDIYTSYVKDTKFYLDIICSDYKKTKKKKRHLYLDELYSFDFLKEIDLDLYNYMLSHKDVLISRKIKYFDESNWYKYGAIRNLSMMYRDGKALYVNQKTRDKAPFFIADVDYFDGSLLCLYPKDPDLDLELWCTKLNNTKESMVEQGLFVGGRYIFTVKTLSDFIL